MSSLLHVATRKGFFTINSSASGWEIGKVDFPGQNVTMSLHDPRRDALRRPRSRAFRLSSIAWWMEERLGRNVVSPRFRSDRRRSQEAGRGGEFGARRNFGTLKEIWSLFPVAKMNLERCWPGPFRGIVQVERSWIDLGNDRFSVEQG